MRLKTARTFIRLVIAEDDPLARKNIVSVARQAGFSVVGEAASGPEAVSQTEALHPDAVLMDIEMPGYNGLEAARRIQSSCPTPIIILTAHDSPDLLSAGARAGAGAYILKPPLTADLACAISIAMARHTDLLELKRLVEQKELLVREVYHRVANQMSVTASLLHLQAARIPHSEAKAALLESENRVRAMAKVHSILQGSASQTHIPLGRYLSALASDLVTGLRPDLQYLETVQGAPQIVSSSMAITCGLLVHELVMNCIRHAFAIGQPGMIELELTIPSEGRFRLSIRDNGKGLPPGFSLLSPSSLGLMIVSALTRDLGGTVSAHATNPGTKFTIDFPVPPTQGVPS